MSRLAQAGDSSTASPGRARAIARATPTSSAAANSIGASAPDSAAAITGASRPSRITARQYLTTSALSAAKSWPLPSPPAISTAGRPRPSSAACVAATVVPFESLTNRTPPISATRSIRCGRPRNAASAAMTLPSIFATVDVRASAASALSALCRPTSARSLAASSSAPPRASQDAALRCTRPQSSSASGTPAPNVCTMCPGRRIDSERKSSRFRICSPAPAKMRALARA